MVVQQQEGREQERDACRSLICDASGIIIAEMAYRCVLCPHVSDSIAAGQHHYHERHMTDSPSCRPEGDEDCDRRPPPDQANEESQLLGSDFDADVHFSKCSCAANCMSSSQVRQEVRDRTGGTRS